MVPLTCPSICEAASLCAIVFSTSEKSVVVDHAFFPDGEYEVVRRTWPVEDGVPWQQVDDEVPVPTKLMAYLEAVNPTMYEVLHPHSAGTSVRSDAARDYVLQHPRAVLRAAWARARVRAAVRRGEGGVAFVRAREVEGLFLAAQIRRGVAKERKRVTIITVGHADAFVSVCEDLRLLDASESEVKAVHCAEAQLVGDLPRQWMEGLVDDVLWLLGDAVAASILLKSLPLEKRPPLSSLPTFAQASDSIVKAMCSVLGCVSDQGLLAVSYGVAEKLVRVDYSMVDALSVGGTSGVTGCSASVLPNGFLSVTLRYPSENDAAVRASVKDVVRDTIDDSVLFESLTSEECVFVQEASYVRGAPYKGGSVGAVVRQGKSSYVLTAAHVANGDLQDSVNYTEEDGVNRVLVYSSSLDFAFEKIPSEVDNFDNNSLLSLERSTCFVRFDEWFARRRDVKVESVCLKCGKSTGLTQGVVSGLHAMYFNGCEKSIAVRKFEGKVYSEGGDSGSLYLALHDGRWKPFAVHRGKSGDVSYATAIEDIVEYLNQSDSSLAGAIYHRSLPNIFYPNLELGQKIFSAIILLFI